MENYTEWVVYVLGFIWILFASDYFSKLFQRIRLPLITGFLITGIIAGPFVLNLVKKEGLDHLDIITYLSLAFIAFAAGAELYLKELRNSLRSIAWNTFGQLVVTFVFGAFAVYFLSGVIPFMNDLSWQNKVAVSLLMATIFVARSPSSAIAVIDEMRAKGPFTQTAIGVTVVKDVLVIILFAISISVSTTLVLEHPFDLNVILLIIFELAMSFALGYLMGKLMAMVLSFTIKTSIKTAILLILGTGVFLLTHYIKDSSLANFGFELYFEPLLICIIGSFVVTNYSKYRPEFQFIIYKTGSYVYVAFFTLTGAIMDLDILMRVWSIALILFFVRLIAMIIGAYIGSSLARDKPQFRRLGWMPYVTQAGVGLGLAIEVAGEFPAWGSEFATIIIAVIVLNQFVGPPLFKWAIARVGESHKRAVIPQFDGVRDAVILGLENQSVALSRQLKKSGWEVKIGTLKKQDEIEDYPDCEIHFLSDLHLGALDALEMKRADAVVLMLSDEENYRVCELVYEKVGTKQIIVRLYDREYYNRFTELGALIVEPATAMVNLLDNFVRSPGATSILLGMEENQNYTDLEVMGKELRGMALRNLRLPSDVIILSVKRKDQVIIPHGYTRLRKGDIVTIVGSPESLDKLRIQFGY